MSAGAYDRRGSSIAADVDAAIERVVEHFESSDLALRMDVLRALSAQARLAFETARVREHLAKHPVSMDLIQGVTSQSPVFKTLAAKLTVDSCSCAYDAQRNVVMATDVRWTLERKSSRKATKKRKKSEAVASAGGAKAPMITKYRFERARQQKEEAEEQETLVKFTVVVAFGDDDATPRELLHFEMACEHQYPKSYYEDQQQLPSDDEEDEKEEEGGGDDEEEKKQRTTQQKKEEEEDEEEEEEEEEEEKEEQTFGEEVRGFRFNNEVLADLGEWMGADEEELDPVDVVGFFMALPVHEDEWLVDERVCEILFRGGMGADSDEEGGERGEEEEGDED
ncbi:hypothetical protein PHYPSEUDO_010393 [Phytophthora pseudosyringae]|uniref:Nucleosome assembly protein n=1 Tax=Phytophthora pseudosyringae TaxID=221518 RepID=A0A8T1VDL6_9STRA|nr:hypothetical protein PHYPSEUDO_010393 [Phytophthora pseudosyringae]